MYVCTWSPAGLPNNISLNDVLPNEDSSKQFRHDFSSKWCFIERDVSPNDILLNDVSPNDILLNDVSPKNDPIFVRTLIYALGTPWA
jgi:hypothetical protein